MTSAKTVTDAVSEFGKDANEAVQARDETAGALHTAASSVRGTGRQGSGADRLDATPPAKTRDEDLMIARSAFGILETDAGNGKNRP